MVKYLSFDIEATGLNEHDLIIEFACVPFDTEKRTIDNSLSFHKFVKCPSFEELKPKLDKWVIEHNEELINKAHQSGEEIDHFKTNFENYLKSEEVKKYFNLGPKEKIVLFGKSMSAIDLPFLNRDLGWDFMRDHFSHRQLDLSAVTYSMIDMKLMPEKCSSGSELMKHLGLGEVAHTALEDAVNTAKLYIKMLEIVEGQLKA